MASTFAPMHYYTTFLSSLAFLLLLAFPCNAISKTSFYPFLNPSHNNTTTTTYIVHTNNVSRPLEFPSQTHWYNSILHSLANTTTNSTSNTSSAAAAIVPRRILYTYRTLLHGFAAALSPQDALRLSRIPGVIGVYPDRLLRLHTTRSPEFLGLDTDYGLWPESEFGEDVIIGLVDTGVWPESRSFDDAGLPPVNRSKWHGLCENGTRFDASLCNNKLVGARFFAAGIGAAFEGLLFHTEFGEFQSPRDRAGHGTHTSSTAAGSPVAGANLFGFAPGTARGMAPRARVAMYKACWSPGFCATSDIVAAIDAAVSDGVDVLSLSIGGPNFPYHDDPMAIATFAAVRRGVFVALSAGNSGPDELTVENTQPWVLTVGAGSLDREFPANLTLGNGRVLVGESLYDEPALHADMIPLVYLRYCEFNLVPDVVMGKIVVCDYADAAVGFYVQNAGGAGVISLTGQRWGEGIIVQPFPLPALTIGYSEAQKLLSYLNSTAEPVARLEFRLRTVIGEARAPKVASFSSRGPNPVVPEILKPDVIGPGSNILAAWPTETPPAYDGDGLDPRRPEFNIISGTSMSCPHLAGIAALLRQVNPRWSPAMIRSAIMTTAATLDNRLRPIAVCENSSAATPLAIGAGLVRPQAARDPGLVYDAGEEDYVRFLCALNYTREELQKFSAETCARCEGGSPGDLNYPSFAVVFGSGAGGAVRVLTRTVTKVSAAAESYAVRIVNPRPDKVAVAVEPQRLEFPAAAAGGGNWEKRSYRVEFRSRVVDPDPDPEERKRREFGYIIWENEAHQVTSPVVFMWE